jgi:hypothetical protein
MALVNQLSLNASLAKLFRQVARLLAPELSVISPRIHEPVTKKNQSLTEFFLRVA